MRAVVQRVVRAAVRVDGRVQREIDAGERVASIEIGATRDLTSPVDLLLENFPYLRDL